MLVRMKVQGLVLDPASSSPVVILQALDTGAVLPIWVGVHEANAIALRLEQVPPPRPMTHDLLCATIERLGARVEQVVVSDLKEGTFFAEVHLSTAGSGVRIIDSRPSDAIALALRTDSPIFVESSVLAAANPGSGTQAAEEALMRKILEDFSSTGEKYEM